MPGTDFLRSFSKYFTNLTPGQKKELDRVFNELQNSKELTSLESSSELLRRKVDQSLPIPQLTVRETIRGANIEWDPLPDQRINFYEIEFSDQANFNSSTITATFGFSTVIDGLDATRFVRVRGVRRDGTTTPYSDVVQISPNLFDLRSHVQEGFYIGITGVDNNLVLGGPSSDLEYTPINESGQSLVWGFISIYADPVVGMFGVDEVNVFVKSRIVDTDGSTVSEGTVWQLSCGEFFNSQTIGPFTIAHPDLNQKIQLRLEVQDRTTMADGTARSSDSTEVFWAHLNVLELGTVRN